MRGTLALDRSLNEDQEKTELERNWAVFMVKTTAYY